MDNSKFRKDLVYTVIDGIFYLEHTEALKVLSMPRTSFKRVLDKLSLLDDSNFRIYKNRKLLEANWVFDFWKNLSAKTLAQKKINL